MRLSFRHQFILTPLIIIIILAGLVAYTILELNNINRENNIVRHLELLTDNIQTTILTATRLNKTIHSLSSTQDIEQDDLFFNFIEQAQILHNNLNNPHLLKKVSPELRLKMNDSEILLRDPEQVLPSKLNASLEDLLSLTEYQYKVFAAQRRTAFIDNHLQLVVISSRLTKVLIVTLVICISLATGFTLWGLYVIRRRLKLIIERAYTVCDVDILPFPKPAYTHDELDDLEMCLMNMSKRLMNVVSVENVLRGVENERRRIAMDMHDGVLVDLTTVNRTLDNFISNQDTINNKKIDSLRIDVDEIIINLRRTIDDLHPQILEILGLGPALSSFLERNKNTASFPVYNFNFDEKIDDRLPLYHKINLFRVIIEAINNVIKHAHCDRFEVCLRIVANQLIITVEDDGIGNINTTKPNSIATGHGCANITERANLIGGTARWRASRFASGTCFEFTLPLEVSR